MSHGPLRTIDDVEYATEWVNWYNTRRLHSQPAMSHPTSTRLQKNQQTRATA